jgi:hypothetical protein
VDLATARKERDILKKERHHLREELQAIRETPIQLAAVREECEYTKTERSRLTTRLAVVEFDLANLERKHISTCNELAAMQGGRPNLHVQLQMPRDTLPNNIQSNTTHFENPLPLANWRFLPDDMQSTADHNMTTRSRAAELKSPNTRTVAIKEEPGQERRVAKEWMQLYRPPCAERKGRLEDMEPGEILEEGRGN